uniref:Integrase, catalytic region, zinc finger, CCHC-type, peptidase aspartic, catalytic n=1 Tax=Tanacetum cinerariifolium TaxID=118510 RepID=A0A699IDV5_TANCI|nr:hypothetical protein [Tanacetum cinerariifolium]
MILESIEHGPLIWPTIEENRVIRTKKYTELSATEKIQADCDMKATNIILQGLPLDIYSLVNHHKVAKDLWERIQLLMQVQSSYPYPSQMNHQTSSVLQIAYQSPQVSTQPMTESPLVDSGFAVPIFSSRDDPIACLNKAMAFLITIASSRLRSLILMIIDCDDISNAKAVLIANISNYGSDVISELPHSETYLHDIEYQSVLARQDFEQLQVGQSAQIVHMLTKLQAFYDNIHKQALGYQIPFHLKKAQQIKLTLYDDIVMSNKHVDMPVIDDEETLILEEESRSKMSEKENDPKAIKQNISHKRIYYEKLNRLTKDFGKRFTLQQELSAEQAFGLHMFDPTSKSSDALPVKIEAPKDLPKISLVNESLKKFKFHLAKFDNVVKIRTTPNALTEREWGFEYTKAVFNNEIISFLKSLKDIFSVFDRDLLNEIIEVETVFDQMDTIVQHSSVDKQCFEIAKKELLLENDRLLQQIMSQDVLLIVMNSMSLIGDTINMDEKRKESCNLEAELLKSQNAFNDLL